MQVLRFRTQKAHGHLDLDITFNPRLTFLTGINGSGKTTVVRGIVSLLSPSFRELAGMDYERLEVSARHNGNDINVVARRTEEDFTIAVDGYGTVDVPIFRSQGYEPAARFNEHRAAFYQEQHVQQAKNPALEFLKSLPTPMFLDLERRSGVPIRRPRFVNPRDAHFGTSPFTGSLAEGLREAQELAEEANRSFLLRRQELTDELRKGLILMAFALDREPVNTDVIELPNTEDLAALGTSYHTVTEVLGSLGIGRDEIAQQVNPFFTKLQEVVAEMSHIKEVQEASVESNPAGLSNTIIGVLSQYFALRPQEQHIQRMVRRAEQYNRTVTNAKEPITAYTDSVNRFLGDSGKRLAFSRRGSLQLMIGDRVLGDLTALSSGERQLVVILTHLSFNQRAKEAEVLIIDEPELSLHIRWQELFVDAVQSADQRMQLILATHSPSIIMERVADCVDLETRR